MREKSVMLDREGNQRDREYRGKISIQEGHSFEKYINKRKVGNFKIKFRFTECLKKY